MHRSLALIAFLLTACNMNLKTGGLLASSPSSQGQAGAPGSEPAEGRKSEGRKGPSWGEAVHNEGDPACYWFPTLVMRQHEGGGSYGPVIHDWDLKLQLSSTEWRKLARAYAQKNGLKLDESGLRGPIECDQVARVSSDATMLAAIRKKKDAPDAWLAAQPLPGEDWQVERNNRDEPVSKTRAILVYKRGGLPRSLDLR